MKALVALLVLLVAGSRTCHATTSTTTSTTTTTTTLPTCTFAYITGSPTLDCLVLGGSGAKILVDTTTTTSTTSTTTTTTTTTLASTTTTTTTTTLATTTTGGATTTTTLVPWARNAGGPNVDAMWNVARDSSNNIYAVGQFPGTATVSGSSLVSRGLNDAFYAKYKSDGTQLGAVQIGGTGDDNAWSVAIDPTTQGVVVVGQFGGTLDFGGGARTASGSQDGYVVKYNSAGVWQWDRTFGGPSTDAANGVAVDASGNVYVTGSFSGTANFGGANLTSTSGTVNVFLVKYDTNGNHQWSEMFTNNGTNIGSGIAVDSAGNPAIVGRFTNTINFGGGTLTALNTIQNIFHASFLSSNGAFRWAYKLGNNTDNSQGLAVTVVASDAVCIGGFVQGSVDLGGGVTTGSNEDAFVRCSDGATGNYLDSCRISGSGNDIIYGLTWDAANSFLWVAGYSDGVADWGTGNLPQIGSQDSVIAKYNNVLTTLTTVTARRFGSVQSDVARGITTLTSGNPVIAGYFGGTGNFSPASATSAGQLDGYVCAQAP